ncbi:hypothetical protein ARMSODRAFT_1027288 [Armillaria solidipes]|uniref:Uncharacterized protein n=1 Tax=Armillaria solidipes TaxID=1076256 RepID=A0A2H3B4R3_9AGAR|nr:hypothetical protein ARMSODRAFT_1027288 [Armillaria solidipes]
MAASTSKPLNPNMILFPVNNRETATEPNQIKGKAKAVEIEEVKDEEAPWRTPSRFESITTGLHGAHRVIGSDGGALPVFASLGQIFNLLDKPIHTSIEKYHQQWDLHQLKEDPLILFRAKDGHLPNTSAEDVIHLHDMMVRLQTANKDISWDSLTQAIDLLISLPIAKESLIKELCYNFSIFLILSCKHLSNLILSMAPT